MALRSLAAIQAEYESVALVLQGGGALGAYQAGVYRGLHDAGLRPNWVAGVSIGAINAAIVAGNPPERRIERLEAFWDRVCRTPPLSTVGAAMAAIGLVPSSALPMQSRTALAYLGAARAAIEGQNGFFAPRFPPPWAHPDGDPGSTSYYDPSALHATLLDFVDFDMLNDGPVRLSVGAVGVRSANSKWFDTIERRIGPEHIMASGALPPAFPAIDIEGEPYWDGGLISNTPLEYVLETHPRKDTLAFQVDLWSARGAAPLNLADVLEREKDIRFSSRTRRGTDSAAARQILRLTVGRALPHLPHDLAERALLEGGACSKVFNIVHLIYRSKAHELESKDYEFSLGAMRDHWAAGLDDASKTLAHPDWMEKPTPEIGVATHDIHRLEDRKDTAS